MAKQVIFVKIFNVGTGNDATIGMVNGNLQWSSIAGFQYWYPGFIDHNTVDIPGQAINISAGGALGGFDGDAEIIVTDSLLHNAIYSGAISVIGKQAIVAIGTDPASFDDAKIEFNGVVSSQGFPDEITVSITCDSSIDFDAKKIPETVITQEMALNNPDSEAIGKSILPTYGNIVYHPMVFCGANSAAMAHMLVESEYAFPGLDMLFRADAPDMLHEEDVYDYLTASLDAFRGRYLLQIVGLWQSATTENVWCCLSANGRDLWAHPNAANYITQIRNAILGMRLKVASGTGAGDSLLILDVEWATHKVEWNDTSITSLWIKLDTSDIASLESSLPYSASSPGDDHDGNTDYRPGFNAFPPTLETGFLTAGYDNGKFKDGVSFVSFQARENVFLLSSAANIGSGVVFYANENNATSVNANVRELFYSDNWKMVAIDIEGVKDDETKFVDVETQQIPTHIFNFEQSFNSISYNVKGSDRVNTFDQITNRSPITSLVSIVHSFTAWTAEITANNATFFYLKDLYKGTDISDGEFDIRLLPKFSYTFDAGTYFDQDFPGFGLNVRFEVAIVNDSNVVIGRAYHDLTIDYLLGTSDKSVLFSFDPENKKVVMSANAEYYAEESTSLFDSINEALKIGETLKSCESSKNVNGIVISVQARLAMGVDMKSHAWTITKQIAPSYMAISRQIDKNSLYYKCVSDSLVTTPAGIVKSIATNNSLPIDADSFASAINAQRDLFTLPTTDFDGQVQPESGSSISEVIQEIAESSITAVYMDSAGNVQAKFLPDEPTSYSIEFNGTNVIRDGLSFSQPKNGYVFSDFSFSAKANPFDEASAITIDTDSASTFPGETEYDYGTIAFASSTGYYVNAYLGKPLVSGGNSAFKTICISGPSRELIAMFVQGTYWKYDDLFSKKSHSIRIDSVCPDYASAGAYGVRVGCFVIDTVADAGITENKLIMRSPRPKWKELVGGVDVSNYAIAQAMWEAAYAARASLGKEQQAPENATSLKNPVWGSEPFTITKWAHSVVAYCTQNKIVIRFESPAIASIQAVNFMDWVSFAWGPYSAQPIRGYIVERKHNIGKGTISFTLLCYGEYVAIPAIITELGELFQLETGEIISPEVGETSKTIGELSLVTTETALTGGADLLATIPGVGNYRIDGNEFIEYIRGIGIVEIVAGTAGQTSFSFANPFETDQIVCSVYDTVSNDLIGVALNITDATISASGLATIEVTGQFRIMVRK